MDARKRSADIALPGGVFTPSRYTPHDDNSFGRAFQRIAAELSDVDGCSVYRGCLSLSSRHWAQTLGVLLVPLTEDLTNLRGFLRGPPDTPFADATFAVDITIGPDYPFTPPKVRFCTGNAVADGKTVAEGSVVAAASSKPMLSVPWHPNVSSQTGYICCTILKEGGWGPAHTLKLLLQGLQTLLQCPEWDDPVNDEVRRMWSHSSAEYEEKARQWAKERALDAAFFDRMLESVPNSAVAQLPSSLADSSQLKRGHSIDKSSVPPSDTILIPELQRETSSLPENSDKLLGSFKLSTKKKKASGSRNWCGTGDTEVGCYIS